MPLQFPQRLTPAWARTVEQALQQEDTDIKRLWIVIPQVGDPHAGRPLTGPLSPSMITPPPSLSSQPSGVSSGASSTPSGGSESSGASGGSGGSSGASGGSGGSGASGGEFGTCWWVWTGAEWYNYANTCDPGATCGPPGVDGDYIGQAVSTECGTGSGAGSGGSGGSISACGQCTWQYVTDSWVLISNECTSLSGVPCVCNYPSSAGFEGEITSTNCTMIER